MLLLLLQHSCLCLIQCFIICNEINFIMLWKIYKMWSKGSICQIYNYTISWLKYCLCAMNSHLRIGKGYRTENEMLKNQKGLYSILRSQTGGPLPAQHCSGYCMDSTMSSLLFSWPPASLPSSSCTNIIAFIKWICNSNLSFLTT